MKQLLAAALVATLLFVPTTSRAREPVQRIVSLIPSLTEDLFALGAGPHVVAVSEFSDYPAAAKTLPRVASLTSIDAERIVTLHPDLVVGISSQAALVAPLERARLRVELFSDDTFGDIFTTLQRLGMLVGRSREAGALVERMRRETAALERTVDRTRRPSVFVVLDVAPIYTVGKRSYIARLIEMAGGTNAARLSAAYGIYSAEALVQAQPQIIIVDPAVNIRSVLDREPWHSLHAVERGDIAYLPDAGILLRPGPRYNEGLRWLVRLFRRE